MGISDDDIFTTNYSSYISDYINENNKLEKYVNEFSNYNYRITDIINDINFNRQINIENKKVNIKNALIKADLVTISVNHDDVLAKLNMPFNDMYIYNWIEDLSNDYENMLELLRLYCKEEIIVLGYYCPKNMLNSEEALQIVSYINDTFKEISSLYNVKYIDLLPIFLENQDFLEEYYPNIEGYKIIANQVTKYIENG